jgi:hypothetical protein
LTFGELRQLFGKPGFVPLGRFFVLLLLHLSQLLPFFCDHLHNLGHSDAWVLALNDYSLL